MKQAIAAVLILLTWAGPARAWSEDGHRIVCAIAWKELARETRALVEDLLKKDSASGFAEACVWADAIRSNSAYDWAKPHHYVNVPAGAAGIDLERDCPPEPGCIIRAIAMHIGTLRQPKASAADKAQALRFLGHFMGDIHQPLHAGYAEDRGGTVIRAASLAMRQAYTRCGMGGLIAGMGANWQTLVERLHAGILDAERVAWQRSDVHDWAEESHRLAVMRAYAEPEGGSILGEDYVAQNAPGRLPSSSGRRACAWPGACKRPLASLSRKPMIHDSARAIPSLQVLPHIHAVVKHPDDENAASGRHVDNGGVLVRRAGHCPCAAH